MTDLVIHPITKRHLKAFTGAPAQALLLVGPAGSGKLTLAERLTESILELPSGGFKTYGQALAVRPIDGKPIGIESARQIEQFLRLKVPGDKTYDRAVVIENGELMTVEAQNALLKTLEEPPAGTIIIITANYEPALLPTVRSRAQTLKVQRPDKSELESFFQRQGFNDEAIKQAYNLSGGQIGLMQALLSDEEHSLKLATEQARQLLSQPAYDRLIAVDSLAKDKTLAADTVAILQRMARLSLQTASGPAAKRWQAVLEASYDAVEALEGNAQPKLVLTKLVLQF